VGLSLLSRGLDTLAAKVRRLEATVSNQALPAECRFDTEEEDGDLYVVIERVGGNRERIAGPL
jgi:hypothetical protein